jgi:hypothetical protein
MAIPLRGTRRPQPMPSTRFVASTAAQSLNAQVPAQKAFDNLVESYEEYAKDEFI